MRILLAGDSFAADWGDQGEAWWRLLGQHHEVTNVAQAGCSEYRILQQLRGQRLHDFDLCLICHTSAYRIYVSQNPLHLEGLHANSDLIYNDVLHSDHSEVRDHLLYWFQHLMDLDHARDIYSMTRRAQQDLLAKHAALHLSFFPDCQPGDVDMHHIWQSYPGKVNHMDAQGNQRVYQQVMALLDGD